MHAVSEIFMIHNDMNNVLTGDGMGVYGTVLVYDSIYKWIHTNM